MLKKSLLFVVAICQVFFVLSPSAKATPAESTKLFIGEKTPNQSIRSLFLKEHPNVEFIDVEIDWSVLDPIERLQEVDELDIIEISNDEGISKLFRNEHVEPLTSSDIASEHQKFFPQIQELLETSGMVMGIPIHLRISPWMVHQELWDAFQLPNLPCTFAEYIDLVDQWYAGFASKHSDYAIVGDPGWGGTRMTLVLNLIDQYVYEQQNTNEPLVFENSTFEALLTRILSIRELAYPEKYIGPLLQGHYDSDFWSIDIASIQNLEEGRKSGWVPMIPPIVVDGATPRVGGQLSVLCLLQQSKNKELAMDYLSFVSSHKDFYQPGLSQMLLSEGHLSNATLGYSSETIGMWSGFVPYITFYTDALGGSTYAREFEGLTLHVKNLLFPWTDTLGVKHEPYGLDEFLSILELESEYYHSQKH